jgi:predicted nucleotidyltransferase component of viral defense system
MLELSQILAFYPEHLRPFRTSLLREYLQYKILEALFESPLGARLAFMGGTCIHIVHGNPRFSEDLDFDNLGLSREEFENLSKSVHKALEREGYTVEMKTTFKTAYRARFRFNRILFESGLTGHQEEKLLIQVDAEPQHFDHEPEPFILNKFDVFLRINAVPADILLAQKLSCIFTRKRAMGRDFFDAVYLLGKTGPNLEYLQQKLKIATLQDLKERLRSRCEELDLDFLARDVGPFIFDKKDVKKVRMFKEYIESVLID